MIYITLTTINNSNESTQVLVKQDSNFNYLPTNTKKIVKFYFTTSSSHSTIFEKLLCKVLNRIF